jgi:hypothetical protein
VDEDSSPIDVDSGIRPAARGGKPNIGGSR